jgi:apolipoprotein N-acyltransferase
VPEPTEQQTDTDRTPGATGEPRLRRFTPLALLALASGTVSAWAFPPLDQPWIVWLAPVGLWYSLGRCDRARRAAAVGFFFGVPYFAQCVDFIRFRLGMVPWGGLALAEALFPLLACLVGWLASRRLSLPLGPLVLASAWMLCEYLRGQAWVISVTLVDFGYALHNAPLLMQTADLGGVGLLTWLVALEGAALGTLLAQGAGESPARRRWTLAVPALIWLLAIAYGGFRLAQPETGAVHSVAIAQPAGALPEFYEPMNMRPKSFGEQVEIYCRLLDEAGAAPGTAELILLPESALCMNLARYPWTKEGLRPLTEDRGAWLVTGYPEEVPLAPQPAASEVERYNTVGLFDTEGAQHGKYRKRRLVGFGEYLPFREQLRWVYSHYTPRPYDLSRGTEAACLDANGARVAPIICFESLYGSDARDALKAGGELLAIHTNDGWYQNVQEAKLHGRVAQFRAVESRVDVLRSATTAFSGHIDSRGRWVKRLGIDEAGAVLVQPHFRPPHSLYYSLGDGVALLPAGLGLILAFVSRRRIARSR